MHCRLKTRARSIALTLILLLIAAPVSGAGLTLEEILELRQVTHATVSPDGKRIAYLQSVPRDLDREEDGPAWSELHVIDEHGISRPYIAGQVNIAQPAWRPGTTQLAFLAKRDDDETTGLYAIAVDGGEAHRLAALETDIADYSFSPDGRQVALIAPEADSEQDRELAEKGFNQVVYEEGLLDLQIHLLDLEDEQATPRVLDLEGSAQAVAWSPAGDRLAVKVSPRQLVDDTLVFTRIRIVGLDGEVIGRIDNPGKLGDMVWSPDGEKLAFIGTNIVNDPREGRLMLAGSDGGKFVDMIPDLPGHVWHLDWVADNRIVYVSYEGTGSRLAAIDDD